MIIHLLFILLLLCKVNKILPQTSDDECIVIDGVLYYLGGIIDKKGSVDKKVPLNKEVFKLDLKKEHILASFTSYIEIKDKSPDGTQVLDIAKWDEVKGTPLTQGINANIDIGTNNNKNNKTYILLQI
ncbi:hypothetical protein K502DRAFT_353341 [Neoconidiobolus thromboides FSU 785]|nr:hypothetical protein K502DRAFT_353341 [Neoconidiobolus thromboides FSU 785]